MFVVRIPDDYIISITAAFSNVLYFPYRVSLKQERSLDTRFGFGIRKLYFQTGRSFLISVYNIDSFFNMKYGLSPVTCFLYDCNVNDLFTLKKKKSN